MIKLKRKKHVLSLINYSHTNYMNIKITRLIFISISLIYSTIIVAQVPDLTIYKAEIGANTGVSYYLGEANNQLFTNMRPTFGGFFRYKLNSRIAFKAELTSTSVSGKDFITNNIYIGDILGEFNFFDLENNPYKRFSKTYSPYIFTGISLMTDVFQSQILPEVGIPFGFGIKIMLGTRWNLNAQWTNRLLLADNLEGTSETKGSDIYNNPKALNGSNLLNNDLISTFTVGISYSIWKEGCDCLDYDSKR